MMKKIFLVALMAVVGSVVAMAHTFGDETLKYVVQYKWGLIQKDSGDATLRLKNRGDRYHIELTGKTRPWADKYYEVRDTLRSQIRKADFKPMRYERIAHEGGSYNHDVLDYVHRGNTVSGKCHRFKRTKKGVESKSVKEFTSNGLTFDMLSVFYYLRSIDFETMKPGQIKKVTMFSGSKKETLSVKLIKKEKVKLRDKSSREAYHISFNFTGDGGGKSSDDIDAWISTDSHRIPLLIEGSLPIGKIRCQLVP